MRVGHDLDGCESDFMESCNLWLELTNKPFRFKPGVWTFYEEAGMSGSEFVAMCHEAADAGVLFSTDPFPGTVAAFNRCKSWGNQNIVITDRTFGSTPEVSQEITKTWLNVHGYDYDELHFSANKLLVPTDTFVEDKLENYDALIEGGVDAYLIDRPWNQVPGGDMRKRIKDTTEYADIIEHISTRGYADLTLV